MIANSGWYTFTQLLHFIDLAVRDFDSHAFSCLPTYGRITMESSMARLRVLIVFLLTVCALVTSFAPAPLRKCPCGISASLQEPPGHVDDAARDFEVGLRHNETTRMKISQANKGKKSWNEGLQHKAETIEKIRQSVQANYLKKRAAAAASLGMTVEEYRIHMENEKEKVKAERKAAQKGRKGLTEEGRKRMADKAKQRWKNPEFREKMSLATRGIRKHSQETKLKIAEKVKLKWQDDDYRAKIKRALTSEQKQKISQSVRKYWHDNLEKQVEISEVMGKNSHKGTDKEKITSIRSSKLKRRGSQQTKFKLTEGEAMEKAKKGRVETAAPETKGLAGLREIPKENKTSREKSRCKIVYTGGKGTGKPRELLIYDDDDEDDDDDVSGRDASGHFPDTVYTRRRLSAEDDNLIAVYDDNGKFVGRFTEDEYEPFIARKNTEK